MKVELKPPFDRLWHGRDAFAEADRLDGKVYRALEGRRTLRTDIEGEGYFVKIHKGVGWREIIKNLLSLRMPVVSAWNEWRALTLLQQNEVRAPVPVAYGARGGNPAAIESFIITRELTPVVDMEVFTRDWGVTPPPLAVKRALLRRIALMVQRMHRVGINHRDCYLCHFLLAGTQQREDDFSGLHIIDLHRARFREKLPARLRVKDLSGLYFSAQHWGLSERDVLRFLRLYYGQPIKQILSMHRRELMRIDRKAGRTLRHHLKHHAGGSGDGR